MTTTILRIDASARGDASVTRALNNNVLDRLAAGSEIEVNHRDLSTALPQITPTWVEANFADPDARTKAQTDALELSDQLIAEVQGADVLVIGMPIYNFGVPATLKTWIDQISRAGVTFRYTDTGPVGLLEGKRAIVSVASGGTKVGSEMDFATGYLRHILGFLGITDVQFIAADNLARDSEGSLAAARTDVSALPLAA
ncbi:MAG: FMN-dependent NADH-azoreductase [Silicimonas sp.]|nr:FMN-dependent NADH-azoreductase [Silicimonas sp.]